MDEGRLGAVRRQQDHHRKSTIVMNDIINFQQNVYTCYLKREQQNTETKMKAQEVFLKRSIARNSYLMQCLEARKQKIAERAPERQILGRYGGRPIHAFSRDVDACIAWRHPRLRRLRRVERAKEKGLKIGAIMDFATIPEKMEAILRKGQEKEDNAVTAPKVSEDTPGRNASRLPRSITIRNQSMGVPNILKIQHAIFNDHRPTIQSIDESRDEDDDRLGHAPSIEDIKHGDSDRRVDIETAEKSDADVRDDDGHDEDIVSTVESQKPTERDSDVLAVSDKSGYDDDNNTNKTDKNISTPTSPPPLIRRPTLILPPIKTTKDMKIRGFDGR